MEKQKLLCQIVNLKFLFIILNKTALRGYTSTVIFCQKSLCFKPQLKMQNLIPIAKNSLFTLTTSQLQETTIYYG